MREFGQEIATGLKIKHKLESGVSNLENKLNNVAMIQTKFFDYKNCKKKKKSTSLLPGWPFGTVFICVVVILSSAIWLHDENQPRFHPNLS